MRVAISTFTAVVVTVIAMVSVAGVTPALIRCDVVGV